MQNTNDFIVTTLKQGDNLNKISVSISNVNFRFKEYLENDNMVLKASIFIELADVIAVGVMTRDVVLDGKTLMGLGVFTMSQDYVTTTSITSTIADSFIEEINTKIIARKVGILINTADLKELIKTKLDTKCEEYLRMRGRARL
jgi:hypothetical protein